MAASENKDTIYVDVDDEITSIIEKVRGSDAKIVALVLPKRAAVLQSVVNMKLLKRSSEDVKKHLVLVTSEAGLLPLAGSVGLHVASTPTSKPVIPPAPVGPSDEPEDIDEPLAIVDGTKYDDEEDDSFDPKVAAGVAVGTLAAAGATSKIKPTVVDEELSLDDDSATEAAGLGSAAAAAAGGKPPKPPKKNKKLAVPNFDTFKKKLLLGVGILVLLIIGYIFAFKVMPKATVTIHTDTTSIDTSVNLTLDTTAKTLNTTENIVPAVAQSQAKTYTQQAAASGQVNNGEKASGNVYFALKDCNNDTVTVPAGTGVTSGGNTYITQADAVLNSIKVGGKCNPSSFQSVWSTTVKVIAVSGGTKYNVSDGTAFAVPGNVSGSGSVSAKANGDIAGGTDNITKIVSQADIDGATAKLATQDTAAIKQGLQAGLQGKGLQPVPSTFVTGAPVITASAKAGDTADSVTVTEAITYTMLGVNQTDLKTLVVTNVNKHLDKGKQVILDDGVSKAVFTQSTVATATSASITMKVTSVAGPQINTATLPAQVAGKKTGDVKSLIKQTPGVTDVTVKYSPFWVSSMPNNAKKITITLVKSDTGNQ